MFSNGIAAFTFDTVHTAIPLEIFVIKKIYELFYAIEFFCRTVLTQIILPNPTRWLFTPARSRRRFSFQAGRIVPLNSGKGQAVLWRLKGQKLRR